MGVKQVKREMDGARGLMLRDWWLGVLVSWWLVESVIVLLLVFYFRYRIPVLGKAANGFNSEEDMNAMGIGMMISCQLTA